MPAIAKKYIPDRLTLKDKIQQKHELQKSRKMYKKKNYYTRKKVTSYNSTKSNHIVNAERIYKEENIVPSKRLARKTGCSLRSLHNIVKKGQGAYYSSGSRPNQTAHCYTPHECHHGKSSYVDFSILSRVAKNGKSI